MASGIYAITCAANGKVYIGSAVDIEERGREHRKRLRAGNHHCRHLQNAWNKYGPDVFSWSVIELVEPADLIEREQHHLDTCEAKKFNICTKAGSTLGIKYSAKARANLSAAMKRRAADPKWQERLAEQLKRLAEDPVHRAKMSAVVRKRNKTPEGIASNKAAGRKRAASEEWRAALAEGLRRRNESPEFMAKLLARNSNPKSEETKAKIAAALTGRKIGPFGDAHKAKIAAALKEHHRLKRMAKVKLTQGRLFD